MSAQGFTGLVDWLVTHRFDAIPDNALKAGKQCLLDGIACFRAGLQTAQMDAFARVLAVNSVGQGDRPIPVGNAGRAGLFDAVTLYANAANILDFDDCFREEAPSHPGATIIGPALACAHLLARSGCELLHAVVIAYEASLRIGAMLCPSDAAPSKDIGYATWQMFGAFIAAGRLFGLNRDQWLQGFGLAAQQAPLPSIVRANPAGGYTWLKNGYGAAAAAGVQSACLAKEGFIGDQHFFSRNFGFWKTYGSDRLRPECLSTMPGDDWWIRRVEFKPWACCRWAHPALEAILQMKPSFDVTQIEHIDVHSFREFVGTLDSPFPTNLVDAQFNARFLIASACVADDFNAALRTPDFESAAVRELFAKIDIHHDAALDRQHRADMSIPTRVAVMLKDGSTQERVLTEPPGSQRREPTTFDDTVSKYQSTLAPLIGDAAAERALAVVMQLETYPARDLMNALFASPETLTPERRPC